MPWKKTKSLSASNKLIGARIRLARRERNLTQEQIAVTLGLQTMAVCRKERGLSTTTTEQLLKIAKKLGRPLEWFIQDVR